MDSFPFDTQYCEIKLSSWVYPNIDITIDSPERLFDYSAPDVTEVFSYSFFLFSILVIVNGL